MSAILIGVVRHEVNTSAGSSGFIGNSSSLLQAANWMQLLIDTGVDATAALVVEETEEPLLISPVTE